MRPTPPQSSAEAPQLVSMFENRAICPKRRDCCAKQSVLRVVVAVPCAERLRDVRC